MSTRNYEWGYGRQVLWRPEARGSKVLMGCIGAPGSDIVAASVERERNRPPEEREQFLADIAAFTAERTDEEVRTALLAGEFAVAPTVQVSEQLS